MGRAATPQRGFTLIELLVTLVIIGVLVSLALLTTGDRQSEREQQAAAEMAALMEFARENAMFNGEDLGIGLTRDSYSFYRLDNNKWIPLEDDQQLRPRSLPEGIRVVLYLEGLKAKLPRKKVKEPQVHILSSGETTPLEIRIGDGKRPEAVVVSDALGNIKISRDLE